MKTFVVLVLLVIAVFVIMKLATNESSKDSPPVACQVFGGHWSIWDGWQCG